MARTVSRNLLLCSLVALLPVAAHAGVTIYDTTGTPLSTQLATPLSPGDPARPHGDVTIDLWCCGDEVLDWSLNTDFYWATAFDTNDIAETYTVTEILWYADGGETEEYWIAPDGGGFPDTSQAQYLGGQSVPPSDFMWQSFDAAGAGATVEPGQIYWLIRATDPLGSDTFELTWRSTTNPAPPLPDPVSISMDFDTGWSPWVQGLNWHMEYEIRGEPGSGGLSLDVSGSCPGTVIISVSGATPNDRVGLLRGTAPGDALVPGGVCAGTELGLADPDVIIGLLSDVDGDVQVSPTLPSAACGNYLQAIDLATCDTSNVVELP